MRRDSRHLPVVMLALAGFACGSDRSVGGDGSLLLLVTSELAIPGDIDRLSVEATQAGETLLSEERDLADQAPPLAVPFVLRARAVRDLVSIKVVAYHGSEARIERSARVTVPSARVAELELSLSLMCVGTARVRGGEIFSTCPAGETCVRGSCAPQLIGDSDLSVSQSASAAKPNPQPADGERDAGAPEREAGAPEREAGTLAPTSDAGAGCPPGAYVAQDAGASSAGACSPCSAGRFSASENALACAPWTTCAAGQYVATAGSASRDRTCQECGQGTFSMLPNSSACVPLERCPAGTRQLAAGSATAPAVCRACSAGQYCDGRADPVACSDDTWDHDHNAATPCVAWSECEPGNYVESDGTASTDRVCAPCPSRTFSEDSNAGRCVSTEPCSAGQVQIAAATPASNIVCSACWPGYYCAGGTAARERCATGSWDHDRNPASACVSWRECGGMVVGEVGTALSDNVCACGPGQHVLVPGSAGVNPSCAACDGATFNPPASLDAEACLSCPGGTSPNAEHSACL